MTASIGPTSGLAELLERRAFECRLTPDRALRSLDEAHEFLRDRGLLTWAPGSSLPSLYEALHEDPADPQRRWWFDALAERDGVHLLRIHRGKAILLTDATVALADPVVRAEIDRMEAADPQWSELLRFLGEAGPAPLEDARRRLGLKRHELGDVLYPLELCGTVLTRAVVLETPGGPPSETLELARWDQVFGKRTGGGLGELLVAGVRAAVVARERELARWFSWTWHVERGIAERLVAEGRLERPEPGWVSIPRRA